MVGDDVERIGGWRGGGGAEEEDEEKNRLLKLAAGDN